MPEFDSAGVRIHYELRGADGGAPIVLVHGYASSYQVNWVGSRWEHTLVDSGRHVIGVDCRGHGRSDKPHDPTAYARAEMAEDVDRLLRHLALEQADYLGYSMGAWIGLHLMIEHPGRIRRAVLGGIGSGRGFNSSESIARRMRGDTGVADPVAEAFYAFATSVPGNDLEALAACMESRQQRVEEAELAGIRTPALIVTGELDDIGAGAEEMAARIPGARVQLLPGRTHMNAVPARQFKVAAMEFLEA